MKLHALAHMRLISLCLVFSLTFVVLLCIPEESVSVKDFNERDYIHERQWHEQGFHPRVGQGHTIGHIKPEWPQGISYQMDINSSLLLEIVPLDGKAAGAAMLISEPISLRTLKTVWAHDDIREPVRFWTETFGKVGKLCNSTGCPTIRIAATKGRMDVFVLDMRK